MGLLLCAFGACLWLCVPARADSTIQAVICRDPASLTIDSPQSDSIVTQMPLTVSGSVTQANQVEVTIDGQFNGVVPLDAAATSYSTEIQLIGGTHTIKLTAIDACQIGNATASIVVTYQAAAPTNNGSAGSQTPTDVRAAGVVVGDKASAGQLPVGTPSLVDRLTQPLINVGRALDIIPEPTMGRMGSSTPALVRIGLLILGVAIIVFSRRLAGAFRVAGQTGAPAAVRRRLIFIAIGVGVVALAFLLG